MGFPWRSTVEYMWKRKSNINFRNENLNERRVAVPTNKEERVSDVPMSKSGQVTD
jgi:hypothetical protein